MATPFWIYALMHIILSCISATSYSTCSTNTKTLIHDPDRSVSSATIDFSSNLPWNLYQICFETNEHKCISPSITINHQEINPFTVQYDLETSQTNIQCARSASDKTPSPTKEIRDITSPPTLEPTPEPSMEPTIPFQIEAPATARNSQCSYFNSCITNYPLSNQTIDPFTSIPIIIQPSSTNNICNSLYLSLNITLSCSSIVSSTNSNGDWSTDATSSIQQWFNDAIDYITYQDRPYFFAVAGGIILLICGCCWVECVKQMKKPKNVKMHPKAPDAKPKKIWKCCQRCKVKRQNSSELMSINIFNSSANNDENNINYASLKHDSVDLDVKIDIDQEDKHTPSRGVIYRQKKHYNDKQMKNIKAAWGNDYKHGPKVLFGDNYRDKKRPKHIKRQKYAGQSKAVGKYDRQWGYGIITTFDDAKERGFNFTDKNFKKLMQNEFKPLHKHLLRGGDIIIPCPTKKDLQDRPNKYFKDGDYENSEPMIHHNLGTGISTLKFHNLLVIQKEIDALKQSASAVKNVNMKLYDLPYDSDDDEALENNEGNDIIEEEDGNPLLAGIDTPNEAEMTMPPVTVTKVESAVTTLGNARRSTQGEIEFVQGNLILQTAWYSKEQMQYIWDQCKKTRDDIRKMGKMVFGDNDTDKFRGEGVKRKFFGGQAGVMGKYDRAFAYGITTNFNERKLPNLKNFMLLIDKQFNPLQQHLLNGYDVVIPKPRKKDVNAAKKRYYKHGKQVIFHNLGTGIAALPFDYIAYIQQKIVELENYAHKKKSIRYYKYSPSKSMEYQSIQQKFYRQTMQHGSIEMHELKSDRERYQCPLCTEERHYLINLKNCAHSICEPCLRGHIYQCLVYEDNPMGDDRFKCTLCRATNFKYSTGDICVDDIKYADDRCECKKCKENNTDSGTNTILDPDRYKQFVIIMESKKFKRECNKTECPECKKPFPITKPWRKKGIAGMDEYNEDFLKKRSFFAEHEHCNYCGKNTDDNDENFDDEKVGLTAYKFNNCSICNHHYCDNCRRNCFYEVGQMILMRPPSPVQDAMIDFNREQQLRRKSSRWRDDSQQPFEICEICWYRYYCRKCPHCEYKFCGMCKSEWNGATQDWKDNILDNDDMNGKHRRSHKSKHSCEKAKAKMEEIENKKKEQRMKVKNEKIKDLVQQRDHLEYQRKRDKSEMVKQSQELEAMRKEMMKWKTKALENENQKLEKEKNESNAHLLNEKMEKERFKQEAAESNAHLLNEKKEKEKYKQKAEETNEYLLNEKMEKEKFKQKAAEEEQKAIDVGKEVENLKKKIGFVNVWQWNDTGDVWKSYDHDTNKAIEALNIGAKHTFTVKANNQTYEVTKTGDKKGTQINTNTKVSRNIRRHRIAVGLNQVQYPKWWDMGGLQVDTEAEGEAATGNAANNSYARPRLVNKALDKYPAKSVIAAFNRTATGYTVTKIESVENQMLFDAYWSVRTKMVKLLGMNKLNERELFHGTRAENVMDLVEKEGFRKEFNKTAYHGKGTYFARDASYSVGYSSNNNGVYKMFLCKVLCGESHQGSGSYELTSWPKKNGGKGLIYDTLVDNTNNPSIYVIHDDLRAYPMWVITFKKK